MIMLIIKHSNDDRKVEKNKIRKRSEPICDQLQLDDMN